MTKPKRRRRVYVAGPYSSDPEVNVRQAIRAADVLADLGAAPFVPHLFHYWHQVKPRPYQDWMAIDAEWVHASEAVFVLPGYSPGADAETALALRLGIPVFRTFEAIAEWLGT